MESEILRLDLYRQEAKLLFMMLVENRGNIEFNRSGISPYGLDVLDDIKMKLGELVTEERMDLAMQERTIPDLCQSCKQPIVFTGEWDLEHLFYPSEEVDDGMGEPASNG